LPKWRRISCVSRTDTIEDGKTGFLFRIPSLEGFVGAVCRAFSTFGSKRQLNTMARRQAMGRIFEWKDSALSYAELYQRLAHWKKRGASSLLSFGQRGPLPVGTYALSCLLARIVSRGWQSISQILLNAGEILTKPVQNKFALLAARHFCAKQLENERIGRLTNSSDRYLGSLSFQARQAASIDKRFRVFAYGGTAERGNSFAGQAQNDCKGR
jgi:hypothetical protein